MSPPTTLAEPTTLAAKVWDRHVVRAALDRAGLDGGEVEDVILGAAFLEGATGNNIARQSAIRARGSIGVPAVHDE